MSGGTGWEDEPFPAFYHVQNLFPIRWYRRPFSPHLLRLNGCCPPPELFDFECRHLSPGRTPPARPRVRKETPGTMHGISYDYLVPEKPESRGVTFRE